MARVKQTARKTVGGKVPRRQPVSQQQSETESSDSTESSTEETRQYSQEEAQLYHEEAVQLQGGDEVQYVEEEAQFNQELPIYSPASPTYKQIAQLQDQQERDALRREVNRLYDLLDQQQRKIKKMKREMHQDVSFFVKEFCDVVVFLIMLAEAPDDEHRLEMMRTELGHLDSLISQMDTNEKRSSQICMMKKSASLLVTAVKQMKMKIRNGQ